MMTETKKDLIPLLVGILIIVGGLLYMWQSTHLSYNAMVEESNIHPVENATSTQQQKAPLPQTFDYLTIVTGCETNLGETCVTAHTQPSTSSPVAVQLRVGSVLKLADTLREDNRVWYKVDLSETLRYPERVTSDWYILDEDVVAFTHDGPIRLTEKNKNASSTKQIIVDRSDQKLYAYNDESVFMVQDISTGLNVTPTPRGVFEIFYKTPSRYMQGPIPGISTKYYDLPGVPWNLYFTEQGAVIHGTYWHNQFGKKWSNGCVNMPIEQARLLYVWADIGTTVIVQD